jgi:predicted alpha/beta-hydrolase family hydrolase
MTGIRTPREQSLVIAVTDGNAVSAVATIPEGPGACLVLSPGAGGGMNQTYLVAVCAGLAARGIATLRYQFPYTQKGSRRPDPPKLCHLTVRAAVAAAHELLPRVPLFAGGKSFGGRMTSQAQALTPLPDVRGICFFGFPLHAAKQPSTIRAEHLASITVPMLFLQGTRDELADLALIRSVVKPLGARATLSVIEHADHSFHVLVRSGTTDEAVMHSMLDEVAAWMTRVATRSP